MSDNYTKLFSSITESTIWGEPAGTRLVWITFLAKCNKHGEVFGSIPGFARLSNVTLEECEQAIATLLAPDKWSRTPDNEGRRIESIDGGWRILNHSKFDAIRGQAERAEYKRRWDKENRPNRPNSKSRNPPTTPDNPDSNPTIPTPPVSSQQSALESKSKTLVQQAARFNEFWELYPSKKGKAEALKKWKARKLDAIADRIISDVKDRAARDRQWLEGFIPNGSTYISGSRWEDSIEPARGRLSSSTYTPLPGEL